MNIIPDVLRSPGAAAAGFRVAPCPAPLPLALDASASAGNDETIPRHFLALFDMTALAAAFAAASVVAPWIQWALAPAGPIRPSFPAWLGVPYGPVLGEFPPLASVAWVLVVSAPATLVFMELLGGYAQLITQSRSRVLLSSGLAPLLSLAIVTLVLFSLRIPGSSRLFILTFGTLTVVGLVTYRSALRFYKHRRLASGEYAKNVVLIGHPSAVVWMSDHFRANVSTAQFRLVGWFGVPPAARRAGDHDQNRRLTRAAYHDPRRAEASAAAPQPPSDLTTPVLPRLGDAADLGARLISTPIHEVIAIQSSGDRSWLKEVLEDCDYFRVRLRIVPEALLVGTLGDLKLMFRNEPLRLPEVVLAPLHLESDVLFLKRLIDIVVSAALLLLLSPFLLLVAAAIKITSPALPVLYPWRVIGLKGCSFTGYKFTTMVGDVDERQNHLVSRNEMQGPVFKLRLDPRVTALGRILRKYSINELPQLWSVFKGDMSLVGPRPAFRHELERYELWHKRKLCVKPGITCLWQVSGRNRIHNFDDWVRLDLQYIDQWSLWLDFRILARTVWAVASGSGS